MTRTEEDAIAFAAALAKRTPAQREFIIKREAHTAMLRAAAALLTEADGDGEISLERRARKCIQRLLALPFPIIPEELRAEATAVAATMEFGEERSDSSISYF